MTITADAPKDKAALHTHKYNLGTQPLSMKVNIDPQQFELEKDRIFRHSWMIAGRVDELPNVGDYFVQEIPTLETSLLFVRGRDNTIRAFHNMCRHRGNKVVHSGHVRGNAKGFSCAFHGWTYDLTGKLVIVPDEDQFFDFDKCDHGLTPVSCEVWEGFIFFNPDQKPKESLQEWLGEIGGQFEGALTEDRYDDMRLYMHFASDVDCNWQVILDAFSEGYHVPFIHGKTLPEALTGTSNPLCHLQSARLYERNRSGGFPANPDYKPTPMEMAIYKFMEAPVFPALKSDLEKLPAAINRERNPYWAFDFHIVFPMSTFILWANGMVLIYNYWPISIDKTRHETKVYWNRPRSAAERIAQEITRSMTLSVVREDMSSLETTQEVYNSGAISHINLSDQEVLVRHSYKVKEDFLNNAG